MAKKSSVNLRYPKDLRASKDNRFGDNYVVFFVHRSSATRAKQLFDKLMSIDEIPNEIKDTAKKGIEYIKSFVTNENEGFVELSKTAAKNAQQAIKDATADSDVKYPESKLGDTLATIMLLLPSNISTSYETNYSPFSLSEPVANLLPGTAKLAGSAISKLSKTAGAAISGLGSSYGKNLASYASRTAINPMNEMLFQGVNNRTFSFKYEFLPRNASEAEEVHQIIRQFKYHQLPELTAATFMYKFPSEFEIVYKLGDEDNEYMNKISSCVLTGVSIEYTPRGTVSQLPSGMPSEISMTLSFKELVQLDRNMAIEKGL